MVKWSLTISMVILYCYMTSIIAKNNCEAVFESNLAFIAKTLVKNGQKSLKIEIKYQNCA